jgi:hypothetical protein
MSRRIADANSMDVENAGADHGSALSLASASLAAARRSPRACGGGPPAPMAVPVHHELVADSAARAAIVQLRGMQHIGPLGRIL